MKKQQGNIALIILLTFFVVIGLSVVGMATDIITIPWLKLGKQVETERGIIERTYNADNALYNYHWFKERFEEIEATENKIKNAQTDIHNFEISAGARSEWTFEDKNEHARLTQLASGIKSYYETIVGEYNARAKEVDRAVFQNELPTFFSIKPF